MRMSDWSSDVCSSDLNPVWVTNFKLPVQRVADRNRWITTVPGGPTFIANLGFDPRQSGQACDPVRAAGLPLIPEVIVQLAIAIDLAAVLPGFFEQLCLSLIFPCPFAEWLFEPRIKPAGMNVNHSAHRADGDRTSGGY